MCYAGHVLRRFLISLAALVAVAMGSVGMGAVSRGAWLRTTDFALTTAHTLERGEVQVGVFGPLLYGITSRVQVGLHPVLLVVGAPNLAVRWRYLSVGSWELAADASSTWSLLGREDAQGQAAAASCVTCGFPGRVRLTTTATWSVVPTLALSVGVGSGVNFLDLSPSGIVARAQASIHWLVAPDNLVSLDVTGELPLTAGATPDKPAAQLMYARAWGTARLGVGVAVGEFALLRALDRHERWWLYPVLDVWWRF